MRHAARRDDAEASIVDALRAAGAIVRHLDGLDMPDLLVGHAGRWVLVEVKTGRAKLRRGQDTFRLLARSVGAPVFVCRTAEEALAALGVGR